MPRDATLLPPWRAVALAYALRPLLPPSVSAQPTFLGGVYRLLPSWHDELASPHPASTVQVLEPRDDPFLSFVRWQLLFRSQHGLELHEPLFALSGDLAGQLSIAPPACASLPAVGNGSFTATTRQLQMAGLRLWGWVRLGRDQASLLSWERRQSDLASEVALILPI